MDIDAILDNYERQRQVSVEEAERRREEADERRHNFLVDLNECLNFRVFRMFGDIERKLVKRDYYIKVVCINEQSPLDERDYITGVRLLVSPHHKADAHILIKSEVPALIVEGINPGHDVNIRVVVRNCVGPDGWLMEQAKDYQPEQLTRELLKKMVKYFFESLFHTNGKLHS